MIEPKETTLTDEKAPEPAEQSQVDDPMDLKTQTLFDTLASKGVDIGMIDPLQKFVSENGLKRHDHIVADVLSVEQSSILQFCLSELNNAALFMTLHEVVTSENEEEAVTEHEAVSTSEDKEKAVNDKKEKCKCYKCKMQRKRLREQKAEDTDTSWRAVSGLKLLLLLAYPIAVIMNPIFLLPITLAHLFISRKSAKKDTKKITKEKKQ
eukprot:996761_1